jgi:hypothetical protein
MSVEVAAHLVRIHINRNAYRSPNPTTGEALYILGDIPKHEKLYREAGGDKEDKLVRRDDAHVHLKEDEHFYSQEVFSILVNGDEHDVDKKEISYAKVVDFYLGGGGSPSNEYLVKYSHGPAENPSGTLAPGQKVMVKDLDELGYEVDFVGAHLVIYGLPYLDKEGGLKHGDLASTLDLNGAVIDPPINNHQVWWRGARPHDQSGRELRLGGGVHQMTVAPDLVTDYSFSFKLLENGAMRPYRSFEEKARTYLDTITAPALAAYPDATPLRGIETKAAAQASPLRYPDTMSARYNLNDVSSLLRGKKVAIIGLGGTGAYILDFIARTHLERIALFDDDKVHVHTIFRIPGFIPHAIGNLKVEALARQYGQWHAGLEPIPERITPANIERLAEFDFVFVSVDDGPARLHIIDWLSTKSIPYVDCGMGLNRSSVGLSGFVRITGIDRKAFENNVGTAQLPVENAKNDEYRKQAQIAELNALNATMAVIRFKQHFKLLDRLDEATWYIFDSAMLEIDSEGRTR